MSEQSDHYEEAAMTLEELEDVLRDGAADVSQMLTWASIHASLASTDAIRAQTEMLRGAQQNVVTLIDQQERAIDLDTRRLTAPPQPRKRPWSRKPPARPDAAVVAGGEGGE